MSFFTRIHESSNSSNADPTSFQISKFLSSVLRVALNSSSQQVNKRWTYWLNILFLFRSLNFRLHFHWEILLLRSQWVSRLSYRETLKPTTRSGYLPRTGSRSGIPIFQLIHPRLLGMSWLFAATRFVGRTFSVGTVWWRTADLRVQKM